MGGEMSRDDKQFDVRWFAWRAVREALAHGRTGGIALHRFRHDLRRFGLGRAEPACHMLSADRERLVAFGGRFGLRPAWIEPPRPRRPDIWHFDLFGAVLRELEVAYPPPVELPPDDLR
ncbi:MAG TPA: hypothetical protein VIL85_09325 [Thermomicrobiales bacterium]|jgi:hypothetical protein